MSVWIFFQSFRGNKIFTRLLFKRSIILRDTVQYKQKAAQAVCYL